HPAPGEPALQARAARAFADLVEIDSMIHDLPAPSGAPSEDPNTPKATGTGGRGALGPQLDLVARCVEAGVATRVVSVSLGGFDTHADEKVAQQRLLTELDTALTSFTQRMSGTAGEVGRGAWRVRWQSRGYAPV